MSATMMVQDVTPKKNLVQKLCEVMSSIEVVAKKGENKFHGYKYAKESDIVEAIRGELAKRNLFIFPNVVSHNRAGDITDIMVEWAFVDGDSGETRTCAFPGCGSDKSDKGVYKALTGSEKYFLMKTFLIPTGDDPEKDNKDEAEEARTKAQSLGKSKAEALRASKAQQDPSKGPDQLCWYMTPDQLFEVTGMPDVMEAHKELLLAYGKRTKELDKVTGRPKPVVVMNGEGFDAFKFEFVDNRKGILVKVPGAKIAEVAKEMARGN